MPRAADHKSPKKNTTQERLRATPFEDTHQLDQEEATIRKEIWRRLTESRVIDELLTKPEFKHVLEEWKAGLACNYGNDAKNNIYRIFSEGRGLTLQLNREFTKSLGDNELKLLEGVIRAGVTGYGTVYYNAKSLIQPPEPIGKSTKTTDATPRKKKHV